jgi:hypothetical protein
VPHAFEHAVGTHTAGHLKDPRRAFLATLGDDVAGAEIAWCRYGLWRKFPYGKNTEKPSTDDPERPDTETLCFEPFHEHAATRKDIAVHLKGVHTAGVAGSIPAPPTKK